MSYGLASVRYELDRMNSPAIIMLSCLLESINSVLEKMKGCNVFVISGSIAPVRKSRSGIYGKVEPLQDADVEKHFKDMSDHEFLEGVRNPEFPGETRIMLLSNITKSSESHVNAYIGNIDPYVIRMFRRNVYSVVKNILEKSIRMPISREKEELKDVLKTIVCMCCEARYNKDLAAKSIVKEFIYEYTRYSDKNVFTDIKSRVYTTHTAVDYKNVRHLKDIVILDYTDKEITESAIAGRKLCVLIELINLLAEKYLDEGNQYDDSTGGQFSTTLGLMYAAGIGVAVIVIYFIRR